MRGRWSRSVNRVVRSTSVPMAEQIPLPVPRHRPAVTSAGRWLIRSSDVTKGLPRPRVRAR
jgi:hypothetical protein